MRLHHLDAGPLRVPGASMVCRILVIELPDRLVLVDSGFSAADVADPSRLGPSRWFLRPDLRIERTVRAQLAARGLDPETVGDVVLTHADVDHASGIRDFPAARIHLAAAEHRAWAARRTLLDRLRYRPHAFDGVRRLLLHEPGPGRWEGLDGVTDLGDVCPGMRLVPLPGHTDGHAGVVIDGRGGLRVIHTGDAAHSQLALTSGRTAADVRFRQALLAHDRAALTSTRRRLERLLARRPELRMVASHSTDDLRPGESLEA